jgi:NADP-dependent aldehyde dehydrogenase
LTLPREVAVAAANGNPIPSDQSVIELATAVDVADACDAAAAAQTICEKLPLTERSPFIRLVATKIDALGDRLTQRAMRESGLPEGRLNGERARTVGQLRLFADEVESGVWQRIRIDHADPNRTPSKPDLRLRMIPLGPVVVFGASNFPLAFTVAGGIPLRLLPPDAAWSSRVIRRILARPNWSQARSPTR